MECFFTWDLTYFDLFVSNTTHYIMNKNELGLKMV